MKSMFYRIAPLCAAAGFLPLSAHAGFNFFNPRDPASIPQTISAAGVYTDVANKVLDTALKYYEVNTALWSDGAEKHRWIVLKPGRKVAYVDNTDLFIYPDSTVFVKNFRLRRIDSDPTTETLWETRLLVNKNDSDGTNHWYGFSYKWNAGATDAVLAGGFDTTFIYQAGLTSPQSYKKWHFPLQSECDVCHPATQNTGTGVLARGVAGFFPVQLKRPAPANGLINQVQWLFDQGVFSGSPPTGPALASRWKSITEVIPAGPADLRFRVLDTMARSYIGANCSGCHGHRGIEGANTVPPAFNFDWWDFTPRAELGTLSSATLGLNVADSSLQLFQSGSYKFAFMAAKSGLDTSAGADWHMRVPTGAEDVPFIAAGHPQFSAMLYRQLGARNAPWIDSVEMRRKLVINGDPNGWSAWMFKQPWGSKAWRDSLGTHTVPLNSVISYDWDPSQMPRLATYIPDTSAGRILGEWARSYRTLVRVPGQDSVVNVKGRLMRATSAGARIQNRVLIVPDGWTGKAVMVNIGGRAVALSPAGRGRYVIPASVPAGLYFFKVGDRAFRASILK